MKVKDDDVDDEIVLKVQPKDNESAEDSEEEEEGSEEVEESNSDED